MGTDNHGYSLMLSLACGIQKASTYASNIIFLHKKRVPALEFMTIITTFVTRINLIVIKILDML